MVSARSGSATATGGGVLAGAADGATGSVSKSSRESGSNGSSMNGDAMADGSAAAASGPPDAAATRATRAAIAPVFPVLEVDAVDGVASSVGKPNRSAASSRLRSSADDVVGIEGADAVATGAEVVAGDVSVADDGAGLDQRPELDATPVALALGDCAAGAGDAEGAEAVVAEVLADAELADAGDVAEGAERAAKGDAAVDAGLGDACDVAAGASDEVGTEVCAEALDEELAGVLGRGGGFAAGGGAAAGAGRAGGTVGIASFEIGLLVAGGRAAVLDAVGGSGRLATVALFGAAEVVCVADGGDCAPAGEVPDEAGLELEEVAVRAADAAVADVGEPTWRVPAGVDVRAADCARPDELTALAELVVALGALGGVTPASELALELAAEGPAAVAGPMTVFAVADEAPGAGWPALAARPIAEPATAGEAPPAVGIAAAGLGEDAGAALPAADDELGAVAFARVGLEPDSDVAVEALRGADPCDWGVLPPAPDVFGVGPVTGGMPNPTGEAGRPAPCEAAAVDADAGDAAARGELGVLAEDAAARGVDTCDASPDDVGADAPPLLAESVSTGPSGSNN